MTFDAPGFCIPSLSASVARSNGLPRTVSIATSAAIFSTVRHARPSRFNRRDRIALRSGRLGADDFLPRQSVTVVVEADCILQAKDRRIFRIEARRLLRPGN